MDEAAPLVTVVTITRTRPALLSRAISAVRRQQRDFPLEHRIVVDDCPETVAMLTSLGPVTDLVWHNEPRGPGEHSGPGRSSRIRNIAVSAARGRWISFLDDDNDWDDDHLRSLVDLAEREGVSAVHSGMRMFYRDGRPYCENRVPWGREAEDARRTFRTLVDRGVAAWDSNVFLDRADPLDKPDGVRTVDTGEWLLDRSLLLSIPFRTEFSADDADALTGEDDKLMMDILRAGHRPLSTAKPTLRYFVGGYSNNYETPFDDTFSWATKATSR